jgi:hypothetical protein
MDEFIKIDKDVLGCVSQAVKAAICYENLTNFKRRLGITGEIGEIFACEKYRLSLVSNPIASGYDAIDENGKKVQIKTRKCNDPKKRYLGRLSSFSENEFDYAILLLLNEKYEIVEIHKMSYEKLIPLINRQKRRNPSIVEFIKNAEAC